MTEKMGQPTIQEAMKSKGKAKDKDNQQLMITRSRTTSPNHLPAEESSSDDSESTLHNKVMDDNQELAADHSPKPSTTKSTKGNHNNPPKEILLNGEPLPLNDTNTVHNAPIAGNTASAPNIAAAEAATLLPEHNVLGPLLRNQDRQQVPIFNNTELTAQILLRSNITRINTENTSFNLPDPIEAGMVRSEELMQIEITPFKEEEHLPPFEHGSKALSYFNVLRGLLSKFVRAKIHLESLTDNKRRHQIPRGLKINKPINAVEPSHLLKIETMQIMGEAENKILDSLIQHYQNVIPKLAKEFTDLYHTATEMLSPLDKRLVVIQLSHFKNELIKEKKQSTVNKQTTQQNPNDQGRQGNREATNNSQRGNQSQQQNLWTPCTSTTQNPWEERPKPQRNGPGRRGRGRERNRNQQRW
jgi:hypothetical protein